MLDTSDLSQSQIKNIDKYDSAVGNENNATENLSSLVSIHYPGVVRDVSKMLETLGGIKTVSVIHSEKNRRLELRWRPDDSFCKPTFGTRKPVVGLLLKIKFRKKKAEKFGTILSCEPIGSITEEYKFCNLCDFQYLATSKDKCFYDTIVPQSLNPDWLYSDASYFLPPVAFSKMDKVQNFNFHMVPQLEKMSNVIGRLRRKRCNSAQCLTFENPDVPTAPKEVPGTSSGEFLHGKILDHLKSLFQARPIYSKNAITCISQLHVNQLNLLLPCVAYYFLNGPWRSLWVRYGYDPRKDPKARIYQMLDFRVRSNLSKEDVKIKRMNTSLPYKWINPSGKNTCKCSKISTKVKIKKEETEHNYIFKPGVIPPSRQYYYQYCDIHLPEVKAMLENLDDVDESAVCHKVDGWLPSALADYCRDIMNKYVSKEVKVMNEMAELVEKISCGMSIDIPNTKSFQSESDSDCAYTDFEHSDSE